MASQANEIKGGGGVFRVGTLVEQHFGWALKPYGQPERGVDALIELADAGELNGRLIGVQVKTGASYFSKTVGGWRFRSDYEHLEYWLNHSLPIIVILVADNGDAYWARVTPDAITRHEKSWTLLIPEGQGLDGSAEVALREVASGPPEKTLMDRLVLDLPFIGRCLALEKKDEFAYLHVVVAPDYSGGQDVTIHLHERSKNDIAPSFSYRTSDAGNLEDALLRQYPWASFELDDDMYIESERDLWAQSYGLWDDDLGQYVSFAITFKEFRDGLDRIRPSGYAGHTEYYDLKLQVNDVGRAVVVLDDFLSRAVDEFLEHE